MMAFETCAKCGQWRGGILDLRCACDPQLAGTVVVQPTFGGTIAGGIVSTDALRQAEAARAIAEAAKLRAEMDTVTADLLTALRALVDRCQRIGGYTTPEQQHELWFARALLEKHGVKL